MFLAPKIKFYLTVNKHGIVDEHKAFSGFTNVSENLDKKECFERLNDDKLITDSLCVGKTALLGLLDFLIKWDIFILVHMILCIYKDFLTFKWTILAIC